MKHLKKFEKYKDEPRVGDYVILEGDYFDQTIIDFIRTNVGKIIGIDTDPESRYKYIVEFENIVPLSNSKIMQFDDEEIIEWASDKEGLKIKKTINKYNI